jgi:hypothetical protein
VRLLILDGIKAACTRHGWDVWLPSGVGAYAETLVYPATALGTTVLSLGHPVKDQKRANERHGYGAGDWLEIVDGVGFRMVASKTPITKGDKGHSDLYAVKDREGGVETHGRLDGNREDPWFYLGSFVLDDRDMSFHPGYNAVDTHVTEIHLTKPVRDEHGQVRDKYDHLADSIAECLSKPDRDTYESQVQLGDWLRADRVQFDKSDLRPAIERMMSQFRLVPVVKGTRKGGRLVTSNNPEPGQESES